jgi:eukaryotic-like serine/threonine-protein kinase
MRRFARFVLLGLVLVLVAMVSALFAMRFAIHGSEVSVPKLIGLTPQQAETTAAAAGVVTTIEDKFYSSDVPEGRVVSQSPAAGVKVRRGWRVRLAESLGRQRIEIPNVVGQSSRAAEINIKRRGLELSTLAIADIAAGPEGQVIAQNPPANATPVAPKMSVLLSNPQRERAYVMPSFLGRHFADVTTQIEAAGFHLGTVTTLDESRNSGANSLPAGTIVRQTPAPGQKIAAGESISFEITR